MGRVEADCRAGSLLIPSGSLNSAPFGMSRIEPADVSRRPSSRKTVHYLPGTSSVSLSLRMPRLHLGGLGLCFSSSDMMETGREEGRLQDVLPGNGDAESRHEGRRYTISQPWGGNICKSRRIIHVACAVEW